MGGIRRSDDKRAPGSVVDDQEDCSDVISRLSRFVKGWGRIPTLFFQRIAFATRLFEDRAHSLLIFSPLYANLKENLGHLPLWGRYESEDLSEAQ
jgi:hypothetical protein